MPSFSKIGPSGAELETFRNRQNKSERRKWRQIRFPVTNGSDIKYVFPRCHCTKPPRALMVDPNTGSFPDTRLAGSVCRLDQFQCESGPVPACIERRFRCDGEADCADGSDETGCGRASSRWMNGWMNGRTNKRMNTLFVRGTIIATQSNTE